jgi:Zn-dependent protease with chaperone function
MVNNVNSSTSVSQTISESEVPPALPKLAPNAQINMGAIRDRWEPFYSILLWFALSFVLLLFLSPILLIVFANIASAASNGSEAGAGFSDFIPLIFMYAMIGWLRWFFWKLVFWRVLGDGIEVGPHQYPQVYRVIKEGSEILGLRTIPRTIILQGHGNFHLMVEKRLSRRGLIIITSNVMDALSRRPSSRELMMLVGRQLGHIKAGHYRFWALKHAIGKYAFIIYRAWWRRCQFTADKVGLMLAGDYGAAERAMCIMTAGTGLAPGTNFEEIVQQRERLFENRSAWWYLLFSSSPYMIDRLVRIRNFARAISSEGHVKGLGAIPVHHLPLRSKPILIIHGHDQQVRLELENFLFSKLPNVTPRVMTAETTAAQTMPEKFEQISEDVRGAIALLTPDDLGEASARAEESLKYRARQNVILEIGWVWARLGRRHCLLLVKGDIEIPSDLSGIEVHRYVKTPRECSEAIRDFVGSLASESGF